MGAHVSCLQSVIRCDDRIQCDERSPRSSLICFMQLLALYDDPSNCTEQDTEERDVSS